MGKSSSPKQSVTRYFMSAHFGVCMSADAVLGIYVNDRPAWEGESTAPEEELAVNKPDLFGGEKREGGLVGSVIHFSGHPDQVMPEHVASRMGGTTATVPGFRGFTSLFFYGGGTSVPVQGPFGIQFQTGAAGFTWSWNNPIIAQKVSAKVRRAPKADGLPTNIALIGENANPAHMIFECMTNIQWGMGSPVTDFDTASFSQAAQVLYNEGFGLSMIWTRQTTIEEFIAEIIDHIQAVVFLNPKTGLWTMKLIRDDYDVTALRHLTPDNSDLSNFERRMWGEIVNEITVSFTNPENEQEETVSAQDLGANLIEGSPVSDSRNYYGVRDRSLAMRLAQRDVRLSSAPLASFQGELLRTEWDITPGEVLLVTWPEYKLFSVVCRVMHVNYGKPGDSTIKVSLMEDVFSLEKPPLVIPPDSQWQSPGVIPDPMDAMEVMTLPAYFALSGDFQTAPVDLEYPEVLTAVLGYHAHPDVRSFELMSEDIISTGSVRWVSHGSKTPVERTVLPTPMAAEPESRFQDALIINKTRGPQETSFVLFGVGGDAEIEITQVVGYDETSQEWILARGVLDTVPRAWPVGTPVWVLNPGQRITDERGLRAAGETLRYKLLTRTSKGVLPLDLAPLIEDVATARPHLPLRPANFKVNGVAFGSTPAAPDLHLTWDTRNRELEDGLVLRWTDGPVPPELLQGTMIRVWDQATNTVVYEQRLWNDLEVHLQSAWFARYASIRIQLLAYKELTEERLLSLQGHSVVVTGLPADPNAPLPPAAPEPGAPPGVDPAPAVGAWAVTGSIFTTDPVTGKVIAQIPAILVSGKRERPDAGGLWIRFKRVGTNDWVYLPEVPLSDEPTQGSTTAVKANTQYEVHIAYRSVRNTMSLWLNLGNVTTGALIATQLGDLTIKRVTDAIEEMEALGAQVVADFEAVNERIDAITIPDIPTDWLDQFNSVKAIVKEFGIGLDSLSETVIERVLETDSLRTYLEALAYVDGVTVKSAFIENKVVTDDMVDVMTALIVREGEDAASAMLRYDKVKIGTDANGNPITLAQSYDQLQSDMYGSTGFLATNYVTYASQTEAFGAYDLTIKAHVGDTDALTRSWVNTNYVSYANQESSLATFRTELLAEAANNTATTLQSYVTFADQDSAFASYDLSIKAYIAGDNPLKAYIDQNFYTSVETDSAIASMKTTIGAETDGKIATATQNFVTLTDQQQAFSSYDTQVKAYINSGSNPLYAYAHARGDALATLEGATIGRYVLEVGSAGGLARMTLISSGGPITTNAIILETDYFLIRGANGGQAKPFIYDANSGKLYSDTIVARTGNIEDLAVVRLKIAGGTVTAGASATSDGELSLPGGGEINILSIGVAVVGTMAEGGQVRISFSCYVNPYTFSSAGYGQTQLDMFVFVVRRNGTPIRYIQGGVAVKIPGDQFLLTGGMCGFLYRDIPGPGNHTYTVGAISVMGHPNPITFRTPDLHGLVTER